MVKNIGIVIKGSKLEQYFQLNTKALSWTKNVG